MAVCSETFLQSLQDDSQISYNNSTPASLQWDDGDDSFEVSEVINATSSDTNLAEALQAIINANGSLEVQTPDQPLASEWTSLNGKVSLKEELKAKIQTRRKSEGVGELRVTYEAPKSYPLTPWEKDKIEKRKHRNRLSANKSRIKRQQREEDLRKEYDELEAVNDKLSNEVKVLQKIKRLLSTEMASHECKKQEMTSSSVTSHLCTKPDMTLSPSTNLECINPDLTSTLISSHQCTKDDMKYSFNRPGTKRSITSSSLAAFNIKRSGGHTSTHAVVFQQDVLSH